MPSSQTHTSEYDMPSTPSLNYDRLAARARHMKQVAQGWLFVHDSEAASAFGWWIFFIIMTFIMTLVTLGVWFWIVWTFSQQGLSFAKVFWGLATLAALWGLVTACSWSQRRHERIKRFQAARVMLKSRVYTENMPIPIAFRRDLRKGQYLAEPAKVCARLSCLELTEDSSATTIEYNQKLLWESEIVGATIEAGASNINANLKLHMPSDPTSSSQRNRFFETDYKSNISWVIEIYQRAGKFSSHLVIPIEVQHSQQEEGGFFQKHVLGNLL